MSTPTAPAPQQTPPPAAVNEQFYILSLKWSRAEDILVWYRPESAGYTNSLTGAGVFTREKVERECDGETTIGIPVAEAQKRQEAFVRRDHVEALKVVAVKRKRSHAA